MVSEKTGTVIGIAGSILVLGFGILSLIVYLISDVRVGIELVYMRFAVSLGIGGGGILGGIMALRGKRSGNIIPVLGGVIGIFGLFLPIGQIGVYTDSAIVYTPVTLFSTLIYIDIILMCLGGILGQLVKGDREVESARKDVDIAKAEKILSDYLKDNKGKAFTAKSLHGRCIEATELDMSITETEKILDDLYLLGQFHKDTKEDVNYYFIP
jgi:hypothetical protein